MAFVHYFDAHFPYTPAAPWDTHYDPHYDGAIDGTDAILRPYRDGQATPSARDIEHITALYHGELSELDGHLAPVLEAAGPDAIVLVTADHGESFSHGYWFNHRGGLWDEITRVPMLLRGPGVPQGAVVAGQVGLIDVAPTLLALAGLPVDQRMSGRDLRPLMRGQVGPREVVWSTTDPHFPNRQISRRTGASKTILQGEEVRTYDLSADPLEEQDLGSDGVDPVGIRSDYASTIAAFDGARVPAPATPPIDPASAAQLEALGYLAPQGPPGPPPDGRHGGSERPMPGPR